MPSVPLYLVCGRPGSFDFQHYKKWWKKYIIPYKVVKKFVLMSKIRQKNRNLSIILST